MLELKIELENKTSYTSFWNFLAKSIIIENNLKKYDKILLIVENQKHLENFKKIFLFMWRLCEEIKTNWNLTNLISDNKWFFLSTIDIFKQNKLSINKIKNESIYLKIWEKLKIEKFLEKLIKLWYKFSCIQEKWSYSKGWDIVTINSFNTNKQYKISFWWNEIEEINEINLKNFEIKDTIKLKEVYIWWNEDIKYEEEFNLNNWSFLNILEEEISVFVILDSLEFTSVYDDLNKKLSYFCCFDFISNPYLKQENLNIKLPKIENIGELTRYLKENKAKKIIFITRNIKQIKNFIELSKIEKIELKETSLNNLKSFEREEQCLKTIICDDIISKIFLGKRTKKRLFSDLDLLLKIKEGDFIVHIEHWIWIFKQIIKKELKWINKEYIEIEYSWNDKLFVPITEIWRVSKYVGMENPKLTWLNTKQWEKRLSKAHEITNRIAKDLLEIYSKRKIINKDPLNRIKQKELDFKNSFEYVYTEDQELAIEEILCDLEKNEPMDRLLVGDVWFGKTEIAFNTIFTNFLNKKQSILLSPLVILAYEHYEKAIQRFKKWWLKIDILTRLESTKKTNETIKKLKNGDLDLVIWTHKILNNNLVFKDLWLIIIDEEHRFWVEDKEKIKKLRNNIDVLSMSATPIPRSLNMALSKLKDISILKNPPYGRKNIDTIVSSFNEKTIFDACKKEFERNGQVFFIHNRLKTISVFEKILNSLFPNKKIVTTHWRLLWNELEDKIIDFKNKKYDILLSTTVIENWIDFSNVNTIIINDSPHFWISQIHQLRWRVWRSDKKWYCYLLYKQENLKENSRKKLQTIVEYSYLWAWFELAMKDLEIRWWWDILWLRQSWQMPEIGVNLFLKMLEEKIEELNILSTNKWEKALKYSIFKKSCKIDLDIEIFIPSGFFSSDLDKLNFYREIENIRDIKDLEYIKDDFEKINSNLPKGFINLLDILRLKILSYKFLIKNIKKAGINYQIDFDENIKLEELKNFLKADKALLFAVTSINKIRSKTKNFESDKKFIEYLIHIIWNS